MGTDLEQAIIGTCENCKKEGVLVRPIQALDRFGGAPRGRYDICFKCFKPRRHTKIRGKTIESPMDVSDEQLEEILSSKKHK